MSETKKISLFAVMTFAVTYAADAFLLFNGGLSNPYAGLVMALTMLVPAISAFIVRLVGKEKLPDEYLRPKFRKHVGLYLLSYFIMQLLIAAGAAVYFLMFPSHFDGSLGTISAMIEQQTGEAPVESRLYGMYAVQILFAFLSGPIVNIVFTFGEEYGWRGFLLPKLRTSLSPFAASLATGVICDCGICRL